MATRAHRILAAVSAATVVTVALAGCVPTPVPEPTPTPTPSATRTAIPRPDPVLHPDGSAAANQQFFDLVNSEFNAAHGMSNGRNIIDNLVASGFVKADMEVTPDTTALNITADAIVFSVRINGECLIGQFSAAGYTGILAPALGTGNCLVGVTRPIDW